jgi:nucleoside-diphosphate-sugar epimerase
MKILFIGGTGIISKACAELAVERGLDLTLLNRGQRDGIPGARQIVADISDVAGSAKALEGTSWDVVVDFISFHPDDLAKRLEIFRGRVGQFIFISSASAYQKPVTDYLVTESTPLANPFWDYSRDKIACEDFLVNELRANGFPATTVRPSFTYGETVIPLSFNSWERPYTVIDRMRKGLPVIIPGDGTSLWQLTHNADFARGLLGLFGHQGSIGHAFHITTDEVLNWNQIFDATAEAAGVDRLIAVHIASDFIVACVPEREGGLHGDKAASVVLDNTKIKRFVPGFVAEHRYREGIRRSIAWYDADPARRVTDESFNAQCDKLVEAYRKGLDGARKLLGHQSAYRN